jgi:hypothetical protein
MSSDGDEQRTRYAFKGRFGAMLSTSQPPPEASNFEVDAFVRHILGLTKNKATESETTES